MTSRPPSKPHAARGIRGVDSNVVAVGHYFGKFENYFAQSRGVAVTYGVGPCICIITFRSYSATVAQRYCPL